MEPVCRIRVDRFERDSGVPELLARNRVEVVVERLPVGDYDVGAGVLVERKTTRDLHESLADARFWEQLRRLRTAARTPFLLVEGWCLAGRRPEAAVRGALLAASDLGCLVLRSATVQESVAWLLALAGRGATPPSHRVRPAYAQRRQPAHSAGEGMLAAVPGISTILARRLLDEFGSVAAVTAADAGALAAIAGMGPRRVTALRRAVS